MRGEGVTRESLGRDIRKEGGGGGTHPSGGKQVIRGGDWPEVIPPPPQSGGHACHLRIFLPVSARRFFLARKRGLFTSGMHHKRSGGKHLTCNPAI